MAKARDAIGEAVADGHPDGGIRKYWIGVVSKEHVEQAVRAAFAQLNHGKAGPLERMHAGDGFAYYSPRITYPDGEMLQSFTALGRIRSGTVYQADAGDGFRPFRIDVDYVPVTDAPIRPLIADLGFIRSKQHWGAAFRFGVVQVPAADFARITAALGHSFADVFEAVST